MHHSPLVYALFLAAAICLFLVLYLLLSQRTRKTGGLSGLLLSSAVYSFGFAMEVTSPDLGTALFWMRFEYLGIVWIPLSWFLFSLNYTGRSGKKILRYIVPMLVFSMATLLIIWNNDLHQLFFRKMAFRRFNGISILTYNEHGIWYWLNITYLNAGILAGILTIILNIRKTPGHTSRQTVMVLSATLFPWSTHLLYQAGLTPYGMDITPFGISIAGIIFSLAIFRDKLAILMPIAYRKIFAAVPDGALILDRENRLADFNRAAALIFPGLAEHHSGQCIGDTPAGHPAILAVLTASPPACISPQNDTPENDRNLLTIPSDTAQDTRIFQLRTRPLTDRSGSPTGHIILLTDITEQTRLLENLREMATIDELTRVFNRRHFFNLMDKEYSRSVRYHRPFCLVMLDLDYFKRINDNYGHQGGDAVLQEAAETMRNTLRTTDSVGRYGGEEFALLLPETPCEQGLLVAGRLRELIDKCECRHDGAVIPFTASFGVAEFDPDSGETVEQLVSRADAALYRAKDGGRNRVEKG